MLSPLIVGVPSSKPNILCMLKCALSPSLSENSEWLSIHLIHGSLAEKFGSFSPTWIHMIFCTCWEWRCLHRVEWAWMMADFWMLLPLCLLGLPWVVRFSPHLLLLSSDPEPKHWPLSHPQTGPGSPHTILLSTWMCYWRRGWPVVTPHYSIYCIFTEQERRKKKNIDKIRMNNEGKKIG